MALKRIVTADQNLQLIQDNTSAALSFPSQVMNVIGTGSQQKITRTTQNAPFLSGNLVLFALVSGQDNLVPHGLNRKPIVWTLGGIDQNTSVWQVATSTLASPGGSPVASNNQFLNLWCGTSCNIVLWVN